MAQFEGYERREAKILAALKKYGISSIDECKEICDAKGVEPNEAYQQSMGTYGRFADAAKYIDPRHE